MKQAMWTDKGLGMVEAKPRPLPRDWVRLRMAACGICGSDIHAYRGERQVTPGSVPGHEIAGTLVEGGKGLADALYAVEPIVYCGECEPCRSGFRHLCRTLQFVGSGAMGGLAEFVDVPEYAIHAVNPSVSPALAATAEPVAVSMRGINLAHLRPDSRVLVLGAGSIGLMTGLLARDRSAEVGITARYPHQRDAARMLGLEPLTEDALRDWARDRRPDVVFETVGGHADTLNDAIAVCRPGGRVVILGVFSEPPPIDAFQLVIKEVELAGSILYGTGPARTEFAAATALIPRYEDELTSLLTHEFPLSATTEAFACANDKAQGVIKVTVLRE
jgi:threonine dehydrogenase-like Zn-dependent dehydrogenase